MVCSMSMNEKWIPTIKTHCLLRVRTVVASIEGAFPAFCFALLSAAFFFDPGMMRLCGILAKRID